MKRFLFGLSPLGGLLVLLVLVSPTPNDFIQSLKTFGLLGLAYLGGYALVYFIVKPKPR